MMTQGIKLHDLRNAELLQFAKDVMGIVTLNNASALSVSAQLADLQGKTSAAEALFKLDQGSDSTPVIEALDLRRDNAISGIRHYVQSLLLHFDPNIRHPAQVLEDNLGLYGGSIARQNYMAETASISHIVSDWTTKPSLVAAVATLQLNAWLAELNAANQLFSSEYLARTQELGAADSDKLKARRTEVMQAYYELRDRIGAYYTINNAANPWGKAIKELNALIEQYKTLLAGRQGNEQTPEA
jgi:hypothetical protein